MSMLAEDVYLLAMDEEQPTYRSYGYGLLNVSAIAGLVGELSLRGRVQITPATIHLLDASATDDELLDDTLRIMAGRREFWSHHECLNILCANLSRVELRMIERLVLSGSLRRTPNGLYATRQWPLPPDIRAIYDRRNAGKPVTAAAADRLSAHMHCPRRGMLVQRIHAVLLGGDTADAACRLLISIGFAARLLERTFSKAELALMQASAEALTLGEPLGVAVRQAHWYRFSARGVAASPPTKRG